MRARSNAVSGLLFLRIATLHSLRDLLLAGNHRITVFAGEKGDLPPDFHVLLGTAHLLELGASLDFALSHPGYPLTDAMAFGRSRVVLTPPPAPRRGFLEAACAVASGSGAIMVALLFAITAMWFDVRSALLVQDAIEPRALAGAMIAGFLALWFWLLLGAIGPSLVSLLNPAQFAPWLSFRRRDAFQTTFQDFSSVFSSQPLLGGRSFAGFGYPRSWRPATRRIPGMTPPSEPVPQPWPFRLRSVPSTRELRHFERKRSARGKAIGGQKGCSVQAASRAAPWATRMGFGSTFGISRDTDG
jgi:hypothetical protein